MTIRILLTEWAQDWKGAEPQALHSALLDLADQRHLFYLVVSLGNGNFEEARFECESPDAEELVIGLLTGAGGAQPIADTLPAVRQRTLFESGDRVFRQDETGYFFVCLRPEAFPPRHHD
jgi:hypothetical protein